jgi:hypothetical protein
VTKRLSTESGISLTTSSSFIAKTWYSIDIESKITSAPTSEVTAPRFQISVTNHVVIIVFSEEIMISELKMLIFVIFTRGDDTIFAIDGLPFMANFYRRIDTFNCML